MIQVNRFQLPPIDANVITKWLHAKESNDVRRIVLSEIAALQAKAINARVMSDQKPNMAADYETAMSRITILTHFLDVMDEFSKNGGVFYSYEVNVGYGI